MLSTHREELPLLLLLLLLLQSDVSCLSLCEK